jgi:signal peptidase I
MQFGTFCIKPFLYNGILWMRMKKIARSVLIVITAVIGLFLALIIFNGYVTTSHEGISMSPTTKSGEILVEKTRNYSLNRFDIVGIHLNSEQANSIGGTEGIEKRIIGLPGETVEIKDFVVYINGKAIDEPFDRNETNLYAKNYHQVTLGDDEYFVLGDNRNSSSDSRIFGTVSREQIKSVAVLRSQSSFVEKIIYMYIDMTH